MENLLARIRTRMLSSLAIAGLALTLTAQASAHNSRSGCTDSSGNIYTASTYPSSSKLRVSKHNAANTSYWVKDFTFPTSWSINPYITLPQVAADASGNVFVAMTIVNNSTNKTKIEVFKIAAAGTSVTTKFYDPVSGGGDVTADGMVVDSNGNFYVDGDYTPTGSSTSTPYIAKFNSALTTVSTHNLTFSGPGDYLVSDVTADASGNIYCSVVGYNTTTIASWTAIFKYNSSFTSVTGWPAVDAFPSSTTAQDNGGNIQLNSSGTQVTFSLLADNSTLGYPQLYAIQHNTSTAATNWQSLATVTGLSDIGGSLVDSNGDLVMFGPTSTGYGLVKLSGSSGSTTWTTLVSSGFNNYPTGLCQDLSGDYLAVYPKTTSGSTTILSVVDPISSSAGAIGTQLVFGSSSANADYGYAVFPTSTSGTFVVSAVGKSSTSYYPLVYRQGSSPWYQYMTATTP